MAEKQPQKGKKCSYRSCFEGIFIVVKKEIQYWKKPNQWNFGYRCSTPMFVIKNMSNFQYLLSNQERVKYYFFHHFFRASWSLHFYINLHETLGNSYSQNFRFLFPMVGEICKHTIFYCPLFERKPIRVAELKDKLGNWRLLIIEIRFLMKTIKIIWKFFFTKFE